MSSVSLRKGYQCSRCCRCNRLGKQKRVPRQEGIAPLLIAPLQPAKRPQPLKTYVETGYDHVAGLSLRRQSILLQLSLPCVHSDSLDGTEALMSHLWIAA